MKKKGVNALIVFFIFFFSVSVVSADPIHDINSDGIVDYDDALEVWAHHSHSYEEVYDVNGDGVVDYDDALEVWANRGNPDESGNLIVDWFADIFYN